MEIKVILDNLMFKKKKPFEIPRKEIKVKVLGHIDLDSINQDKKFLIKYDYSYNKLMAPETYVSIKNGETISKDVLKTSKTTGLPIN